jgi:beta-N-acetylhexosaminidase
MKKTIILLFILLFSAISSAYPMITKIESKKKDSLDLKIGQMIMVGFRGTTINNKSTIVKDLTKYNLGGIVLFDYDVPGKDTKRNIEDEAQLKYLCESLKKYSKLPLFISIDQEGGRVNRLKSKYGFPNSVSAQYLGKLNNLDSTKFYSIQNASLLKKLGINMNFAPCVDLNTNPDNPVIGSIERSFSANPDTVIIHAEEIIKNHNQMSIFSTLKHFPGHGSSKDDSHLDFVDVTSTWSKNELKPYSELIRKNMVDIIMTAHIFNENLDKEYPATLSKKIITKILRDSLKYNGLVVSDDMQMKAISDYYGLETAIKLAINAGVDIVIFANNTRKYQPDIAKKAFNIIKKLVINKEIPRKRIDESFKRIMKLKNKIK